MKDASLGDGNDSNTDNSNKDSVTSAFSLGNLFGGPAVSGSSKNRMAAAASSLRGSLEPHPSVRPHISPLNRLSGMAKHSGDELLPMHPDVRSGTLKNGLPYIILPNKSPPGRFEAHLQVFSGSGE